MWLLNQLYELGRYEPQACSGGRTTVRPYTPAPVIEPSVTGCRGATTARPNPNNDTGLPLGRAVVAPLLWWLVLVVLALVPLCAVVTMVTYTALHPWLFNILTSDTCWVIGGVVYFVALWWVLRRLEPWLDSRVNAHRWLIAVAFMWLNVAALIIAWGVPPLHIYDSAYIWDTATQMALGTFNAETLRVDDYMNFWNWQLPISAFNSLLIRLFGPDTWAETWVAFAAENVTLALTYTLLRRYLSPLHSAQALVMMGAFLCMELACGWSYTDNLSLPWLLLALMMLERRDVWGWLWAGASLAVMCFFRPMTPLMVLVVTVYALLRAVGRGRWVHTLRLCAVLTVGWLVIATALGVVMRSMQYTRTVYNGNRVPAYKFIKGLTNYHQPVVYAFPTLEEYASWEWEYLGYLVSSDPAGVARAYCNKTVRWIGEADWRNGAINVDESSKPAKKLLQLRYCGWGQYIVICVLGAMGLIRLRKRLGSRWPDADPFVTFFVLFFGVHIVIEMKSGYRLPLYPIIFMMAGLSFVGRGHREGGLGTDAQLS